MMGFVGERLKTARIIRNMTIQDLEERVSVSKQAISQYENGEFAPKPDVLFQLVTILKFPKEFFFTEMDDDLEVSNTFFRALFSTKKLDLETQRKKTKLVYKMYEFLSEYLNLPALNLPDLVSYSDYTPEECAKALRKFWKLAGEPVQNMVSLLERNGIVVSSYVTGNHSIDAYTQIYNTVQGKRYCVVLGDDKSSYVRRNFDCAHELGHIIMHSKLKDISEFERKENKELENEANRFAAEFLLPSESFYMELKEPTKLKAYVPLKQKWKVSIGAMVVRARHLDRISNQQYQNMYKAISAKGWRKNEPYDDQWALQKPLLFNKSVNMLLEHDVLTKGQIVDGLKTKGYPMLSGDIEELLDLPQGILTTTIQEDVDSNIISIKSFQSKSSVSAC